MIAVVPNTSYQIIGFIALLFIAACALYSTIHNKLTHDWHVFSYIHSAIVMFMVEHKYTRGWYSYLNNVKG